MELHVQKDHPCLRAPWCDPPRRLLPPVCWPPRLNDDPRTTVSKRIRKSQHVNRVRMQLLIMKRFWMKGNVFTMPNAAGWSAKTTTPVSSYDAEIPFPFFVQIIELKHFHFWWIILFFISNQWGRDSCEWKLVFVRIIHMEWKYSLNYRKKIFKIIQE